jgi:hypothetical protein
VSFGGARIVLMIRLFFIMSFPRNASQCVKNQMLGKN